MEGEVGGRKRELAPQNRSPTFFFSPCRLSLFFARLAAAKMFGGVGHIWSTLTKNWRGASRVDQRVHPAITSENVVLFCRPQVVGDAFYYMMGTASTLSTRTE